MDRFALDLTLDVVEGSAQNLGELTLWCRLRANAYNPIQPKPQLDVVYRTIEQWNPLSVKSVDLRNEQLEPLIRLLDALSWPGRELRVSPVATELAGIQEVRLRGWLHGKESQLSLILQYGGLQGPDAEALRQVFRALAELAGLPGQERWIVGT